MTPRTRRLLLLVLGIAVAWYVVILIWATRPIHDTVPIGNQPDWEQVQRAPDDPAPQPIANGQVANRKFTCNAVFDSSALDSAPPALAFPQQYNRAPCSLAHGNGRTIFALDTLVAAGVVGVIVAVLVRDVRRSRRIRASDAGDDEVDRLLASQR